MLRSFVLSITFKSTRLSVFKLNVIKVCVVMLKGTAPIKLANFLSNFDTLISKMTHSITLKNAAFSRLLCLVHLCSVSHLRALC
jgi:hypothetical protein